MRTVGHEIKKKMNDIATLTDATRHHDHKGDDYGKKPEDNLRRLLNEWQEFQLAFEGDSFDGTEEPQRFMFPAPLIAEGLVRVTTIQDPAGTSSTVAIVHADWSGGTEKCEEQWVIFDTATGPAPSFMFVDKNVAGTTYSLSLAATASYPARLPWPKKDHATGASTTFWYPVSYGKNVSAQGFFDGIKAGLAASTWTNRYRYLWGTMTREVLTDKLPGPLTEYIPEGESARGWEEEVMKSSVSPQAERSWAYAEWEQPMHADGYTPVQIHMAWGEQTQPQGGSVMSGARTPNTRPDINQWLALVRSRLGVTSANTTWGSYGHGVPRLYNQLPSDKPTNP